MFVKSKIAGKTGLVFILFLAIISVNAQTPDSSNKYHIFLEPYFFTPAMSGTADIGNLPNTFVCVPAADLLKNLKSGGMLYAELHNNRLAFTSDLVYAHLSQDATSKKEVIEGTADIKQFWWELEGLYRVNPWLETGLGVRFYNLTTGFNLTVSAPGGPASRADQKTNIWIDPLIVTRLMKWVSNRWFLSLRADLGGFGIGSRLSWQLQPLVGYKASRLLQLSLGYRVISMDYNNQKTSNDKFLFDIEEYGPQIKIGFNL